MKISPLFRLLTLLAFAILISHLVSCNGERCAATESALDDVDADCVEDSGDNCPTVANPDQFDSDSDDVGAACDGDDTDDNVNLIKELPAEPAKALFSAGDLEVWIGRHSLIESTCEHADEQLELTTSGEVSSNGLASLLLLWGTVAESVEAIELRTSLKGLTTADENTILATDGDVIKILDLEHACEGYYQ